MIRNRDSENRRKRIIHMLAVVYMLCIPLLLGGCASPEQRAQLRAVERQAAKNARNYVKEKYDFKAKVVEVQGETGENVLFPNYDPTGYAFVTMEYLDREFQVYITGEEASTEGRDNYQKDIIMEAMEERASETFVFDTDNVHIDVIYDGTDNLRIDPFFDGTNIEEVSAAVRGDWEYKVYVTDVDLQNVDTQSIIDRLGQNSAVEVVNCYGKKAYESVKNGAFTKEMNEIGDYGIYVDDYLTFDAEESEYVDLNLVEYEEIVVVMIEGTYCDVEETVIDPMEWKGRGYKNPVQLSEAYAIETDAKEVFVFWDISNVDEKYLPGIALRYTYEGMQGYDGATLTEEIGSSYLSKNIYNKNYSDIVAVLMMEGLE